MCLQVLALIDGRMGLVDVLNEECVRPSGNDEGFVNKAEALHKGHAAFARRKTSRKHFSVRHYAGTVEYTVEDWLEKNKVRGGERKKRFFQRGRRRARRPGGRAQGRRGRVEGRRV